MTTDTSKITTAADELSSGLTKGGSAAKTLGQEIANAIKALDGRLTALESDVTEPPIEPPGGTTLPPLSASSSIAVSADNQTIENKLITGNITGGRSNLTIRNCIIQHNGRDGIYLWDCNNLTLEDVLIEYVNGPTGQTPLPGEYRSMKLNNIGGTITMKRVTVVGSTGLYAVICKGNFNISHFEGHNMRSPAPYPLCGQLMQFNQVSGTILVEDFSVEDDPANSCDQDNINLYTCTGPSIIFRRGLIDGNTAPAGCAFMVESTSNVTVEDVDAIHQMNGGPAVYAGSGGGGGSSSNVIYRRFRTKDTIQHDQGRGAAMSGYCTYVSSPGVNGAKFEQCKHFNVNTGNLAWDVSTMATRDWANADFTPRAPIRNKRPGT